MSSWRGKERGPARRSEPLTPGWTGWLDRHVRHYRYLPPPERSRLEELVPHFVASKEWVGRGGLLITEEIRVTIAGYACLLVLGFDGFCFDDLRTIVVHPDSFRRPDLLDDHLPVIEEDAAFDGEAWAPSEASAVELAWKRVLQDAQGIGQNVVLHEFAHLLDGSEGGRPSLGSADRNEKWLRVAEAEYLRLVNSAEQGRATLLDQYGVSNRAEWFAVATECFFERPHSLQREHAELFEILSDFFRQNPCRWLPDLDASPGDAPSDLQGEEGPADVLLDLHLDEADAAFSRGLVHLNHGRHQRALVEFTRAIEVDAEDPEAHAHRAMTYLGLDQIEEALADAQRAIASDPTCALAHRVSGQARYLLGDFLAAIDDCQEALSHDEDDADAYYCRGLARAETGQFARAIEDFDAAIRNRPHWAEVYLDRSRALESLGRGAEGTADRERAFRIDPSLRAPDAS